MPAVPAEKPRRERDLCVTHKTNNNKKKKKNEKGREAALLEKGALSNTEPLQTDKTKQNQKKKRKQQLTARAQ